MGAEGFLKRTRRRNRREMNRRIPLSMFSVVLLILGFLFWYYFLHTTIISTNCEFAVNWISGWFDFRSPWQLFAAAFGLCFLIWLIRLTAYWRNINIFETACQGLFIFCFAVSLGFVKARVLPYGTPSFEQAIAFATFVSPKPMRLEEERDNFFTRDRPEWPYDFPPPPSYPYGWGWFEGYNPEVSTIFKSKNSPTYYEYDQLFQCVARYRQRLREYTQAIDANQEWYNEYGWRVDRKYLYYDWE